jgi:hypothetical protein
MDFSTSKESLGKLVAPDRQLMANAPGVPRASGKWTESPVGESPGASFKSLVLKVLEDWA